MIDLGTIKICGQNSVHQIRHKIYRVVEKLCQDSILATRLATAVSQMTRWMYQQNTCPQLSLNLDSNGMEHVLVLTFTDEKDIPDNDFLIQFFDKVRSFNNGSGMSLTAKRILQLTETPKQEFINHLKEFVESKSRDELMSEISEKNIELQESLDTLKRTKSAKERMESELNIGREIQMSMLPLVFPPFPERTDIDLYAVLKPARAVGGDFYDYYFLDEYHLCFTIGDVSDKGVPAALFMAMTKTLIKSRATDDLSPASIVTHINNELSRDNNSNMFVTLWVAIVNMQSGKMVYTNAGHNPPFIKRSHGALECLDSRHGFVVGAMGGFAYKEESINLESGDMVISYTDGVTEAMNINDQMYSDERLELFIKNSSSNSCVDIVNGIVNDVEIYKGKADQSDDITVLTVKYMGGKLDERRDEIAIKIKNKIKEINTVQNQVTAFCEKNRISKAITKKLYLVFDELLSNVISYAYADDKEHVISMTISLNANRLTVTLTDDGIPFNPFEKDSPDIDLPLEERELGGLGIHLVRNVMDKVSYQRRINQNVVSLVMMLDNE